MLALIPTAEKILPDRVRIAARLAQLWEVARGPGGGADRPAFSNAEARAMRLVAGWAADAGLEPGIDRHGNLWAPPRGWTGPVVSAGSHVDTVPDGGRYDGALGTVLGLELAQELRETTPGGARGALLVCAAEEASRFGVGTIGSRLLAGTLAVDALERLHDADGVPAREAQASYLEALDDLPRVEAALPRLRAHAEIHVAQRFSLRELGVVERVATPHRLQIELTGEAGHAGELSMLDRRDALAGAAEVVLAIERAARDEPPETVATVGSLQVEPGGLSIVPAYARLGVDARAVDAGSLARLDGAVRAAVDEIAARRGLDAAISVLRTGAPVTLDPGLADAAVAAAAKRGFPARRTWSGAGHDAQHLAGLVPALLLFVPLHGGQSHTPAEGADAGEIEQAVQVTRDVLATR